MKWTSVAFAAPGIALVLGMARIASEGSAAIRPQDALLGAMGVMLIWAAALAFRARYPDRPLWILMLALALFYALQPFTSSANPWLYTVARAARPAVEVLLIWIMITFPSGRLSGPREKGILIACLVIVGTLWLPSMMLSPHVPMPGPFVSCGHDCPRNVLFVADQPELARFFLTAYRLCGGALLMVVSLWLLLRLLRSTPLMRRTLAPVLLASVARTSSVSGFLLTGSQPLLSVFTIWAVPLAIVLGMLRGRLYTARALQKLVSGLRRRPDRQDLRNVLAEALDDSSLQVGFWDPALQQWRQTGGDPIPVTVLDDSRRACSLLKDDEGRDQVLLVYDKGLLEEPMLVDAVVSSMQGVLDMQHAETALAFERAHSASIAEEERRRIEQDLHDGAQQRLLALRIKLRVSERLLENDPRAALGLLREMDGDVEAAIREIRNLAAGIVPSALVERGLAAALQEAAYTAGVAVETRIEALEGLPGAVEHAIYFTCLEAMQNAAKHGGPHGGVRLHLWRADNTVDFRVENFKASTDETPMDGKGIANMTARIRSVGGTLRTGTTEGVFQVNGSIPIHVRSPTPTGVP